MSSPIRLRRLTPAELTARSFEAPDARTARTAVDLVEDVRSRGAPAVEEHARSLDGWNGADPLVLDRRALARSFEALDGPTRALLERTAGRIDAFARAQLATIAPLETAVPGGRAGHRWIPVDAVGAYAPGGRYPLPSSVLMTAIPARVAGVPSVVVASPRPTPVTLAAAHVAGADALIAVGGAQAIGALAFGTHGPRADVIVGPGNRYVTAAKKHLFGEVGLDGLAGPSELLVIADGTGDPAWIAADLLAQAEHDPDARTTVLSTDPALLEAVDRELGSRLGELPTRTVAGEALRRQGASVEVPTLQAAAELSDRLAPEHLQLLVRDAPALAERLRNYGGLFVGARSAEVFGDYGAGPNHVLPTGGGGRFQAGLSVFTYLRAATWLELDRPGELVSDTSELARLEGLEGHARAALARGGFPEPPDHRAAIARNRAPAP